jgi:UDP-glucose 4-epimerase
VDIRHSVRHPDSRHDTESTGRRLRLLITGNRGYIGSHLGLEGEGCDWKDRQDYRQITGEWDVVIHLAASVSVIESFKAPIEYFNNNAFGIANFLDRNKIGRFVFVSTGGAMYGDKILAREDDACVELCRSPYARSKFVAESYVRQHPDYCILRLANVYGGDSSVRGEAAVHARFAEDDPIVVYGGKQTRDFVDIDVVTEAIRRAAFGEMIGTFNVGSGQETSISEVAEACAKRRGVGIYYDIARPGEVEYISLDCSAARNAGLID